ncbi:hypothetical protein [Carboxylicivirga caseinilyticus]|uniref:hypothetical protein n=1 Tax=Carboxylicivirga caseinilyticus TaxID=3417572 RepID=UPI003D331973|nr:hypothetical protein [Marinilabiliaceae bacterium A049]
MDEYVFRRANKSDLQFIVETIIEAEKSGTEVLPYSSLFGLSEKEVRELLKSALEEDVEDCDLSLSGFIVAEYKKKPVAALNAWIEGLNGHSSVTIKGNLLGFLLPREALIKANKLNHICSALSTDYKPGEFWLGPAYVVPEHQGRLLLVRLFLEQIRLHPEAKGVYCQVFSNNKPSILNFKLMKFETKKVYTSADERIKQLLPSNSKHIFYKDLLK